MRIGFRIALPIVALTVVSGLGVARAQQKPSAAAAQARPAASNTVVVYKSPT